eukprot:TRINITY_DN30153_c0_g1_i2.p1 TRINITY_DN30153_c0_g1~~TRINITY_DN30153_c0_g1_i2.p1  ORF type:complete len:280 (+),score=52.44 TRINITY_DN30153_c0_g1_i2:397-1236(+)
MRTWERLPLRQLHAWMSARLRVRVQLLEQSSELSMLTIARICARVRRPPAEVSNSGGVVLEACDAFDPAHGSSQGMLRWLRSVAAPAGWLCGQDVLDYGCGSGALGICALRLGGRRLAAVDLDRRALAATRINAQANGLADRVDLFFPPAEGLQRDFDDFFDDFEEVWRREAARLGSADLPSLRVPGGHDEDGGVFGCVLANMRKNALLRCARSLVKLCRRGGVVAVSGFMLDFEERVVVEAFRAAGLECRVDLDAPCMADYGDFMASAGYGVFWGRRP